MRRVLGLTITLALGTAAGCDASEDDPEEPTPEAVRYRVSISNIAEPASLQPSTGDGLDVIVSPGVWAVHEDGEGMLHVGESASPSLEQMAEDGQSGALIEDMRSRADAVGTFGTENVDDDYATAPLGPGDSTSFEAEGLSNQRLSFLGMFIHSNDVVFSTLPEGIALDELEPGQSMEITASLALFDVGTEQNEEPGIGPSQPMQSMQHDVGESEMGVVERIEGSDAAGYAYPAVGEFLSVSIERLE